jgi:hypothetical protein
MALFQLMGRILTCGAVLTAGSESAAMQTLDMYDSLGSARLSYRGRPLMQVDYEKLTCEIFGVVSRPVQPYQAEQTLATLVALQGAERLGRRQGQLRDRLNPELELGFVVVVRSDTSTSRSPIATIVRSRLDLDGTQRSMDGLLLWSTTLRHCLLSDRAALFIMEDATLLESALNDASRRERRMMSEVAAIWCLWGFGVSATPGGTEQGFREGKRDCVSRRECGHVAVALVVAGHPWYGDLPSMDP